MDRAILPPSVLIDFNRSLKLQVTINVSAFYDLTSDVRADLLRSGPHHLFGPLVCFLPSQTAPLQANGYSVCIHTEFGSVCDFLPHRIARLTLSCLVGGYHKNGLMAYIVCAVLMAGFAIGVVLAYEVYSVGTFADHEKMGVSAFCTF